MLIYVSWCEFWLFIGKSGDLERSIILLMARLESAINIDFSEWVLMRLKFLVCGCQALLNFLLQVVQCFFVHIITPCVRGAEKTGNFYADLPEE